MKKDSIYVTNMKEDDIYMTTWEQFLNHGIQDPAYLLLHTARGTDFFGSTIKNAHGSSLETLAKNAGIIIFDSEDPRYNYFYHWAVAIKETAMWFKLAYQDNVAAILTEAEIQWCLDDVKGKAFQYLDQVAHGSASPARFITTDAMISAANASGLVHNGNQPLFLKAVRFSRAGAAFSLYSKTIPGARPSTPAKPSA